LAKERLLKESNALAERVAKAHRDMEEQIAANTALLTQTSHKRLELVTKQDEITRLQVRQAAGYQPQSWCCFRMSTVLQVRGGHLLPC